MIPIPPPTEPAIGDEEQRFSLPWYTFLGQVAAVPEPPSGFFRVSMSTDQVGVVQGATTTVLAFNNEGVDANGWYNTTTFTYSLRESGIYQFYASAGVSAMSTTYTPEVGICFNGSTYRWGPSVVGVSSGGSAAGAISYLVISQTTTTKLQFVIKSPSTIVQGNIERTFAYGYKIGTI